jgi:hypothetical protein
VLSDNGNEFRAGVFTDTLVALGARHSRIRSGRPQTNGHVERLHRTIVEECRRRAFARFCRSASPAYAANSTATSATTTITRAHTGRLTAGRCPAELVNGARETEPRRAATAGTSRSQFTLGEVDQAPRSGRTTGRSS